ncbi:MAG: transcriptional regulator [Syntrophobacteraceae bacterium CG2_30_61_12]|nr:MAG: transcriptional regulator [Syntrophobacteraceae bacterium CG2_30_61_12]
MSDEESRVLEVMQQAGKPLRPGDIAQQLGLDGKAVTKIINNLKKQGKVTSPKRCFHAPS